MSIVDICGSILMLALAFVLVMFGIKIWKYKG